jgi:hypothetical protein
VPTIITPPSWNKKLPASERFEILAEFNNEAVLDKETGLVWEKSPSTNGQSFAWAERTCYDRRIGERKGWHVPTIEQLASLVAGMYESTSPHIPAGHPFENVQENYYWSSTTVSESSLPNYAWVVDFSNGTVHYWLKTGIIYAWCVRGGQSHDAY